jgi:tetratricopeptide (TPR) repeat protein
VTLDPANAFSYELLGEIANLNHRLDEAETYFEKAFSLNPDSRIRARYEKVKKEKDLDQVQQQYSDEHFIIRYRRSDQLGGSKIRDILREAYRAISQDFGYYPRYKIPVILYDRDEYQTVAGSVPHWSAALYDGKIRLPVYEQQDANLKKLIFHELTHAFVLDLSQMKCPVWLNEGLAQYQENKIQAIDLRRLSDAVHNKILIPMDQLIFTDVSKITDQDQAILFYLESFSFTSYLIRARGFYQVKTLLAELGKSTPFDEAFETAFGRSFKDMAGEWHRNINRATR